MTNRWLSVLSFAILAVLPVEAAKKRPASQSPPKAAGGALYSATTFVEARRALDSGDISGALEKYCDMLMRPSSGSLWTVSVVLLCDTGEIKQAVEGIRDLEPVFVVKRKYEGRTCFRVCAGLTTDKREAVQMRVRLPESFKNAGPFPVEISFPCDPSLPGFQKPAPPSAPVSKSEAPAAPIGPTGAEVMDLTPVSPQGPASTPEGPAGIASPAPSGSKPLPNRGTSPFAPAPLTGGPGLPPSPAARIEPPPAARNPEAEALFQKGLTAYNLGDRKLAESNYRKCLEMVPDKPEALTNLGILYVEEKKYKDAKGLFEAAVAKSPGYARAHLGLAGALWGLQEYREGLEEARSAVNLDSHDVSARLTLASFLRAVGEEQDAMKEARMVLLMEPNNQRATEFVNSGPPKKPIKLKEKSKKKGGEAEASK